jgi:uncharacterized protein YndB with AHSA1/START domain
MIDVTHQIQTRQRRVEDSTRDDRAVRVLTIGSSYDTSIEDLWDACTNPERIPRWFLPISGDLRLGGRYQLEGNAGGTVERCDPPAGFAVTWEMGDMISWVEVSISADDNGGSLFELRHIASVDEHWDQYGPGAVGIGWDLGLIGLDLHLASGLPVDSAQVMAWTASPAGAQFMALSGEGWLAADVASGADPNQAKAAAARTLAAYTGSAVD